MYTQIEITEQITGIEERETWYLLNVKNKKSKKSEYRPTSIRILVDSYETSRLKNGEYLIVGYVDNKLVCNSIVNSLIGDEHDNLY